MPIIFSVLQGDGLSGNAMKGGQRIAVERQTALEHKDLLDPSKGSLMNAYAAAMSMPPGPMKAAAIENLKVQAELREREYPKYWDDSTPRRPVSQSSSWVGNVRYDPDADIAYIQLGKGGKWFAYPDVTPEGLARFLNSPSLGKFLNDKKPYTGQGF